MPSTSERDRENAVADGITDDANSSGGRDPTDTSDRTGSTRRRLLAAGAGLLAGLAGCSEQTEPSGSSPTDSPVASPETPTSVPTEGSPAPALSGRWPTVYADAANTGTVEFDGPRGTPRVRWQGGVDLETDLWVTDGPDGAVAVQTNGLVVAYDADGSRRWQQRHPGRFSAAPVVASDGAVVVGSRSGEVTVYEPDGSRRWRRTTMEGIFAPHANDATPFRLAGDAVLLAHPRGEAIAFDLESGLTQWSVDVPRRSHRPVVEGDRAFLVGNGDDRRESLVQSLALSDGSTQWSVEVDRTVRIGLGSSGGTLYHGDIDGLLVARDPADGSERWRVQLPDDPWISTVPRRFGGRVWIGTLSAGLFAVTEDGVQRRLEMGRTTTPAVGDGRLYVGSTAFGSGGRSEGRVVALDADGEELWRTATRGQPNAQVSYHDGVVLVGTGSGVVDALDAASGEREWRTYERSERVPSPVVGDGAVYCGSQWNWANGFRASDGTSHLWGASFDAPAPAAPVVAGERVLTGSLGGGVVGMPTHEYADPPSDRLTATATTGPTETDIHVDAPLPEPDWRISLDGPVGDFGYGEDGAYVGSGDSVVALTAKGDIRWESSVGERVREAPAAVGGTVYAATAHGTVLALGADDGEPLWRQAVSQRASAPAVARVDGEPIVLLGTDAGVLAIDGESGEERWRTETGRVRGSPAVTDELVVAGDGDGVLRGLALGDGRERWRVETGGAIHGAPAVGSEHVYVGSRDRHLYAVAVDDGTVAWRRELADWVDGSPAIGYGAVFVVDQSGTISAVHGSR